MSFFYEIEDTKENMQEYIAKYIGFRRNCLDSKSVIPLCTYDEFIEFVYTASILLEKENYSPSQSYALLVSLIHKNIDVVMSMLLRLLINGFGSCDSFYDPGVLDHLCKKYMGISEKISDDNNNQSTCKCTCCK